MIGENWQTHPLRKVVEEHFAQTYAQNDDYPCALQQAMANEMLKPPHLRQRAFYLVCFCPRCRRATW